LSLRAWKGKLVRYKGTKIIRVYNLARMKVYRTAYFYYRSIEVAAAIHINEDEDEDNHAFIARSDSSIIASTNPQFCSKSKNRPGLIFVVDPNIVTYRIAIALLEAKE